MHHDTNRAQRVASTIRNQLAELIGETYPEFKPKLLSITHLRVSPDLAVMDVYCSCLESEDISPLIDLLQQDAKQIRHRLAQHSQMKKFPALRFHADEVQNSSRKIDDLLKQLKQ